MKSAKNYETILPFSCCPLVFPWKRFIAESRPRGDQIASASWLIVWIPLLPCFPGNFRDSVEFRRIRGNFGKTQGNLVEFSGGFSGVRKRVVFQKGGFGGCSPGTKTGTRARSPKPPFWKPPFYLPVTLFGGFQKGGFQKGWFRRMFPRNENQNEGTFAKTTLLRNRPFISQWVLYGAWNENSSPPLISREISWDSVRFGRTQGNSVEFSGVLLGVT